jgi:hypothetical protein
LWSPLGTGDASVDPVVLSSAIQDLEPLLGGGAPVYRALDAAFALLAARAPGSKALVAVLGGSDDTIAAGSARDATLTALRRARDAAGVLPILVDASADGKDSAAIAELAAALRAPVIALPFRPGPEREPQPWSGGIYSALQLAAELVDGAPLRSLTATFRVKTYAPSGFVSGTTLRGTIITENDLCPMGCGEVAQEFVVSIP